jgi:fucose permease
MESAIAKQDYVQRLTGRGVELVAAGVTILQVTVNPLVVRPGRAENNPARLGWPPARRGTET